MSGGGAFKGLIEQGEVGRVTLAIENAIIASMIADRAPTTEAEVKRRFNLCADIFKVLRGDMKWSIARAIDKIPEYLRCELDGVHYDPKDARAVWLPSDAAS